MYMHIKRNQTLPGLPPVTITEYVACLATHTVVCVLTGRSIQVGNHVYWRGSFVSKIGWDTIYCTEVTEL